MFWQHKKEKMLPDMRNEIFYILKLENILAPRVRFSFGQHQEQGLYSRSRGYGKML